MKLYDQNIWGNTACPIGNRNLLIKELIAEEAPDICCFQECNPTTSRAGETPMQEILKPDYVEVAESQANVNFTPIFYRPDTVRLLDGGYFPFEGFNDIDSKSVTWGVFQELATGKKVCVMSVHFWWKWDGEKDDLQRQKNAEDTIAKAKTLFQQYHAPVIITGDFNSGETSVQGNGGYAKMIELGATDMRKAAKESDDAFTCTFGVYPAMNEQGIYENGAMPTMTIDYILAWEERLLSADRFSVINTQKARNSSDHSPLVFTFQLV